MKHNLISLACCLSFRANYCVGNIALLDRTLLKYNCYLIFHVKGRNTVPIIAKATIKI